MYGAILCLGDLFSWSNRCVYHIHTVLSRGIVFIKSSLTCIIMHYLWYCPWWVIDTLASMLKVHAKRIFLLGWKNNIKVACSHLITNICHLISVTCLSSPQCRQQMGDHFIHDWTPQVLSSLIVSLPLITVTNLIIVHPEKRTSASKVFMWLMMFSHQHS